MKLVQHSDRDAAFDDMLDELSRLLMLRFEDFPLEDYGGDVVYGALETTYQAGLHLGLALGSNPEKKAEWDRIQHEKAQVLVDLELARSKEAQLEAEANRPQGLHSSEMTAIAVSDHDCPGVHQ